MEMRDVFCQEEIEMPERLVSEYKFYLKGISLRITIRLYESVLGKGYLFTQSHFIKTPTQIDPYETNHATGSSEEEAVRCVLRTFVSFYNSAIKEGHEPEDAWLVPNKNFY